MLQIRYICLSMKAFRSISSIVLALLVLLASSSFYVGVHVCGGAVKAVALLQEADGCEHQSLPPCHRKLMDGCCENDVLTHDVQDINGDVSLITFPALSSTDIVHNTILLAEIVPAFESKATTYSTDPPPGVTGNDIVISTHSLLI